MLHEALGQLLPVVLKLNIHHNRTLRTLEIKHYGDHMKQVKLLGIYSLEADGMDMKLIAVYVSGDRLILCNKIVEHITGLLRGN
jgi:hypothetical protein